MPYGWRSRWGPPGGAGQPVRQAHGKRHRPCHEDEEDFKSFLEQNRQYWDYVDDQLLERMKGRPASGSMSPTTPTDRDNWRSGWRALTCPIPPQGSGENDWATSWQKYYKPMAVGQRLYIVPEVGAWGRPCRTAGRRCI